MKIEFNGKKINAQLPEYLNDPEKSRDEKQLVFTWRNFVTKGSQKSYWWYLNPAKVDVIDLTKVNFTQPLSIKDVLDN